MKSEDAKKMTLKIAALVEKARSGNRVSFHELVSMFQQDIHRLAYYRTFSQMDAEDLTQEVFEQAYRKMDSLHDLQRFRSWLYSIAVNRCNDSPGKENTWHCCRFVPPGNRRSWKRVWTETIIRRLGR